MLDFADGVWLVELAALSEPRELDRMVGAEVGAPAPVTRDSLLDFLRAKHCLVILDNCEHLIDASSSVPFRRGR